MAERSASSTTAGLAPEDAGRRAVAITGPPAVGGRHRATLAARWRLSRRSVAMGASLAGVLGAAGFVALATAPNPTPPSASLAAGPVPTPPLPLAGPPIVPATPSTATSTPVEEVASIAPPRSATSRRATARPAHSNRDDRAAPVEARGLGGGDPGGHQGGHQGGHHGNGNGRGHGK